ncbi:hypothetical protein GCM10027589_25080 [Actinocorallia lasiicapitis]
MMARVAALPDSGGSSAGGSGCVEAAFGDAQFGDAQALGQHLDAHGVQPVGGLYPQSLFDPSLSRCPDGARHVRHRLGP